MQHTSSKKVVSLIIRNVWSGSRNAPFPRFNRTYSTLRCSVPGGKSVPEKRLARSLRLQFVPLLPGAGSNSPDTVGHRWAIAVFCINCIGLVIKSESVLHLIGRTICRKWSQALPVFYGRYSDWHCFRFLISGAYNQFSILRETEFQTKSFQGGEHR